MADETVEISKADLTILQRAKGVLDNLYTDGDVGMDFKRLLKKKYPDTRIAEIDIVDKERAIIDKKFEDMTEREKKLQERLDNWEKSQKDKEEEGALKDTLADVKKKYGFTDDGMQKVIARMKDKNNPDAEAAAAFIKSQEPKPETIKSSSYMPEDLNLFGSSEKSEDASIQALHKDPRKWQDQEIKKIMDEFENAEAA